MKLELEDLEPKDGVPTWRAHWPQEQPWRSLSWRAHKLAESRREEQAEAEALAYEEALADEARLQGAATMIESRVRYMMARRRVRELQRIEALEVARIEAEAAAAAADEAAALDARKGRRVKGEGLKPGEPPPAKLAKAPKEAPVKAGKAGKAGKSGKEASKEQTKDGKDLPNESAKDAKESTKEKAGGKGKGKDSAGKSSKASPDVFAGSSKETVAATKIEAYARGVAARRIVKALVASNRDVISPPATKKKRGSASALRLKRTQEGGSGSPGKRTVAGSKHKAGNSSLIKVDANAKAAAVAALKMTMSTTGSPRGALTLGVETTRQQLHGWITLAEGQ